MALSNTQKATVYQFGDLLNADEFGCDFKCMKVFYKSINLKKTTPGYVKLRAQWRPTARQLKH